MSKRKILVLGIILVLSISVIAFGDNHVTKVEAFLAGDLNFNVDGEQWVPKDVDGSDLTPIIYNDRTYIPVRSLLEDKGVTVGYEAESRTVLIDYSTIDDITQPPIIFDAPGAEKSIDKASPLLMTTLTVRDDDSDGDGISDGSEHKEITLKKNPDFDLKALEMTQEINFNLSESAVIEIDGKRTEMSLDELIATKTSWDTESAVFTINKETNAVEKMSVSTLTSDEAADDVIALDIVFTLKVGKVTVTITIPW